jgi:hypothetical protein
MIHISTALTNPKSGSYFGDACNSEPSNPKSSSPFMRVWEDAWVSSGGKIESFSEKDIYRRVLT